MRMLLGALLVFAAGCSAAHADQSRSTARIAIASAPAKLRAPYDVQVIRENGDTLPTYAHRGRFYVQGNSDERYVIRVTNPTPNRVEAVVTVDGLDVIDGESGDLRKRGYVVPAYGDVRIEGFRTSQADVATFRFSAVADSYAGLKGKARNVGVIAVAIFEERAPEPEQQIIVGGSSYGGYYRDPYDGEYDEAAPSTASRGRPAPKRTARADRPADARPAPAPTSAGGVGTASRAPAAESSAPSRVHADDLGGDYEAAPPPVTHRHRPGLGTEFGESRYSAASFTRFVRAHNRPIAIAELRYNDTAGLVALGIPVSPLPDEAELMTRETADPFPGDRGYARPPGY